MSGANFPRAHVWAGDEDVTTDDLNGEFDNILQNLGAQGVGGDSQTVAQMRQQVSPGGVGSESLATSTQGELERLRFVISRLLGGSNNLWYDAPAASISSINNLLNSANAIPANRVVSGRVRNAANDAFPVFLQADGTLPKVTLKAASTPFNYYVAGAPYTISADVALSGMSTAASVQNTALVSDTGIVANLYAGERDNAFPSITLSSVGTNISNLVGQIAAFSHVNAGNTEYFIARVASATSLDHAMRGVGFNNSDAPVVRRALSNGDTITLCRLHWIYATTLGSIQSSTSNPTISATQPSAPSIGDYWFDLTAQLWKTYNGALFVPANAVLIGWAIADTSGVKVTRSVEFFASYSSLNTLTPFTQSSAQISTLLKANKLSVAGMLFQWPTGFVNWNSGTNLAPGVSLAPNSAYYLYVTEQGITYLDTERPYTRQGDLLGDYHPYHLWRSVGSITTDGASAFMPYSKVGTPTSIAAIGQLAESANINYNNVTTTASQIASVQVCTEGGLVDVSLEPSVGSLGYLELTYSYGAAPAFTSIILGYFQLYRDGVLVTQQRLASMAPYTGVGPVAVALNTSASALSFIDNPPAGKHTYELWAYANAVLPSGGSGAVANFGVSVANSVMHAKERS